MSSLGANIKRLREELGLTQAELAREVKVDVKTIYRLETEEKPRTAVATLYEVARRLNTPVAQLFASVAESSPQEAGRRDQDVARVAVSAVRLALIDLLHDVTTALVLQSEAAQTGRQAPSSTDRAAGDDGRG